MFDAGWTEWRNYSRPRWYYVTWLPEGRPLSVFKSATLGTRSLFASAVVQSEMSIQVQKNVLLLRISKSLICDELNELLTFTPVSAMTRSKPSGSAFEASATSARTSGPWSTSVSGNHLWTGDTDPIEDVRDFLVRLRADDGMNRVSTLGRLGWQCTRIWLDEANGWLRSKRELY